jgi:TolB-like protein
MNNTPEVHPNNSRRQGSRFPAAAHPAKLAGLGVSSEATRQTVDFGHQLTMLRSAFQNGRLMDFFKELNRRNVVRVGIAYLLFAWVIIQVTDTVAPVLRLPEWTLALVTWISIIGFPFALLFAWAFELTPEGVKRDKEVDHSQSIAKDTGRRIDRIVIVLLVIAVVFLVAQNYIFDDEPAAEPIAQVTGTADSDDKGFDSIGVLPFTNMSNDPDQDYFSDGISEELLNALAKLKNLQVAARTSSFAFKGQNQDITEIGRKLKVDTVLEGSVRKSGTRLRITAQLIEVDNGFHLWSETYDRELTDIFAVQDEITAAIVDALLLHFDTGETLAVAASAATNMSAYDAYLQGRHQMQRTDGDSLRDALTSFRAATEADPNFAPAWAGRALAVTLMRETAFRDGIPREESRLLARAAIDRALALDPQLADAYVAEGMLFADDYRHEEALASLEKAVEINPNLADAWTWLSRILSRFGRVKEAIKSNKVAMQLDPHNPIPAIMAANLVEDFYDPDFFNYIERNASQFARVGELLEETRIFYQDGVFDKAAYDRLLASPTAHERMIAAARLEYLKELDEELISRATRVEGEFLMWVYISMGQFDKAEAIYDALPPARQAFVLHLEERSIMQAALGQCDAALDSLNRAHGGEIRIHGEVGPNANRSNSNLALNQAYCLRALGREEEAEAILKRLREYVATLRENTVYGFFQIDAKLQVLDGDTDAALAVLEKAASRNEISWTDRNDPILRTLGDKPRFAAIFADMDKRIDDLRAELGMPPSPL